MSEYRAVVRQDATLFNHWVARVEQFDAENARWRLIDVVSDKKRESALVKAQAVIDNPDAIEQIVPLTPKGD